ncbi:hypothetical protein GCM10010218_24530 [Streptomyces mashuensis]|uniref:Uncharacterized protein n=1 Tax=Streptomyces mashuensis TaxID=33904 RepID=A0A919ECQ3_9ACTN|nr:hypothetical protein [Streptomyces mashuensis]GHF42474.1 hypothetical protein GCM10010218_24530 [Streptomyces mashuensis]
MTDSTQIRVTGLRQAVTRVLPHVTGTIGLDGMLLDFDGEHLYAVASDLQTMAIGRASARESAESWSAFVDRHEVAFLANFVNAVGYDDEVELDLWRTDDDEALWVTAEHRQGIVNACTAAAFLDWRKVVREHLTRPLTAEPIELDPALMHRWTVFDEPVFVRRCGQKNVIVVTAPGFLGLQKGNCWGTSSDTSLDSWLDAVADNRKAA